MQKGKPNNTTGVDVTLSVIDSNGNYREIGTTNDNADGFFSYDWMPDIEGKYTVYAAFRVLVFWPSHSVTAFNVDPAITTPAPTSATQTNLATTTDVMMFLAVGVVAIIIAIAIATVLLLRKRP